MEMPQARDSQCQGGGKWRYRRQESPYCDPTTIEVAMDKDIAAY